MSWTAIDNATIKAITDIGLAAFAVYVVLKMHTDAAGECWPSVLTIARLTGTTVRTVRRALVMLQERGWIRIERRKDRSGRDMSSRYILSPVGESDTEAPPVVLPCQGEGDTNDLVRVTQEHHELDLIEREPIEQEPSSCRKLRFDAADMATASWMFTLIQKLDSKAKHPNLDHWAAQVRLMRERDRRTDNEIRNVFAWANADNFWRSNILCPAKLRAKFSQLSLKMKSGTNGHARKTGFPCGPGQRHTGTAGKIGVF